MQELVVDDTFLDHRLFLLNAYLLDLDTTVYSFDHAHRTSF